MAENLIQYWNEAEYCNQYAATWEISVDEVHYGWLSPGENKLKLLADVDIRNSVILDLGFGMGENLICLAKRGGLCFGIDISPHMHRFANRKARKEIPENLPNFVTQDMRLCNAFPEIFFDLILSVYSLEYLNSIKELRDVFAMVANRLKPGGVFLFCFFHPLQHYGHKSLSNETARAGHDTSSTLIFSFRDAIACLDDCQLMLDRVVEQATPNPSKMTYEKGKRFPYHFRPHRNPCVKIFDSISNTAPHTVIYKARKSSHKIEEKTRRLTLSEGSVYMWNRTWNIKEVLRLKFGDMDIPVAQIEADKEIYLYCHVFGFEVRVAEVLDTGSRSIPLEDSRYGRGVSVPSCSLLSVIYRRLERRKLTAVFGKIPFALVEHPKLVRGIFLRRIDPIFGILDRSFPNHRFGVIVFVNRDEPGSGKVGLDSFTPSPGDCIEIAYISSENPSSFDPNSPQPRFPNFF